MSHAATKWAFDQPELHRDMKPSEWAVLMVLADCHNPVNGCFPSQDYICSKTNLGERAVRDQLAHLRERGLIDWDAARENGKRGSNRYRLGCEADFQPANSAGSSEPASTGENKPVQPAESDTFNRQNLPPNLVREPVKEPEEREAREREVSKGTPIADAGSSDDPRKFEARVKRLAIGLTWPGFAESSTAWAVAQFAKLSDAERAAAEARAHAYVTHCGKKALSIGTYFLERKWIDLPAAVIAAAEAPTPVPASPFGKIWGAMRLWWLLQPSVQLPRASAFLERLMAEDSEAGQRERIAHRARHGWPAVNHLHRMAMNGSGIVVPKNLLVLEAVAATFEKVRVGSEEYQSWKALHEARGWPWLPDPGRHEWVYFPAGGPAGLEAFEIAVRGNHDAGGREAAE